MVNHSAGILLYRFRGNILEVMLVHPGGPFWAKKDNASWSIPKGLIEDFEDLLEAAKREFHEETGFNVDGDFTELGSLVQPSKKIVTAFALLHDLDTAKVVSNTFELEWPPKSGITKEFPEIDKAEWFSIPIALKKILKGQSQFINKLMAEIGYEEKESPANNEGQLNFFD